MKKIAIVTGASSGMGKELIVQISRKYPSLEEIWIVARRQERLLEIKKQIKNVHIRSFALDLNDKKSFEILKTALDEEKPRVGILANSAGFGISGSFEKLTEEEIDGMIELNCNALTKITRMILPYMGRGAQIYQFASSAAFCPQPGFSIYAATKAYVLNFTLALRQEIRNKGIKVTAVCPGPVKTEFFETAYKYEEMKFYKKFVMADPKKVVKKALQDGKKNKAVSIYGVAMKFLRILCKICPEELIVKFIH